MTDLVRLSAKPLTTPTWLACAVAFVLHQVVQKGLGWSLPLLDNHLDPLLGVVILLGLAQAEKRLLFGWLAARGWSSLRGWRRFTALEVTVMTAVLALIFEGVFPWLDARQTRDAWDVVAVGIGAVVFWVGVNRCG